MIPSFFLENGSLYFYANWKKYSSFICKYYSRKKTFGGVAMVTIFKTKGNILENNAIAGYDFSD